jgi:hypothetical protein
MEVAPQKRGADGEAAYLNFTYTSRKGYLFLPKTAMTAAVLYVPVSRKGLGMCRDSEINCSRIDSRN